MSTQEALTMIWHNTPRDYRAIINETLYILVLRDGGTQLVPLSDLTCAEISARLQRIARH